MAKRLLTILLLLVVGCACWEIAQAKHKKQPATTSDASAGDFDYFLLTLSWAPEFCATNPNGRTSVECAPNQARGLVVHGLWPQYDNGKWPQDCASTPPVASSTVNHMMPIMPGKQLIQHEWEKHGTCSGLSVQDYFGAIEKLYNALEVPPEFKKPAASAQSTPAAIEQKFAAANNAPKRAFRVSCPQNEFSAVEVCLSKDLQYQSCPNTVKECRAPHVEIKPVP
jgi:ribonuclease T2